MISLPPADSEREPPGAKVVECPYSPTGWAHATKSGLCSCVNAPAPSANVKPLQPETHAGGNEKR